ncbi:MAG: MotA/TolQ/ExbB proton channel family protein [Phycisphaeraceae bacterium]
MTTNLGDLLERGGLVMWPLLALSVTAMALVLERGWFFVRTNHPGRRGRAAQMGRLLRQGRPREAGALASNDGSVYGDAVAAVLAEPGGGDAVVVETLEAQRRRLERFLPTLSTIITAAPMLGILGTVLGIIASFEILSARTGATDPASVSQGIAEALLTTALGLLIAVATLFPYNAFRAQVDRTLSRLESLAQAARQATAGEPVAPGEDSAPEPANADKSKGSREDGSPAPLGP